MQLMEKKTFFSCQGVKYCQFAEIPASEITLEVSCGVSRRLAIAATLDVDEFTSAIATWSSKEGEKEAKFRGCDKTLTTLKFSFHALLKSIF